jgi:hypothetical protein
MAEAEVPYSWAGRRVAAIVEESRYNSYGVPRPPAALPRVGTLEAVNALGMVAILWSADPEDEGQKEAPVSTFYPWSSVVWLRLAEES